MPWGDRKWLCHPHKSFLHGINVSNPCTTAGPEWGLFCVLDVNSADTYLYILWNTKCEFSGWIWHRTSVFLLTIVLSSEALEWERGETTSMENVSTKCLIWKSYLRKYEFNEIESAMRWDSTLMLPNMTNAISYWIFITTILPWIARPSADTVLTFHDIWIFVAHEKGLQLPAPSQY